MSDEQINVKSWEVCGYEPQGSIEIAAPEALPAVVAERKGRKNRPPSFCRLRRQTAPVLYVKRGKRDGKRDYKLSTETGEVQSAKEQRPAEALDGTLAQAIAKSSEKFTS